MGNSCSFGAKKLALAREHRGGGEDSGGDAGHGGEREHLPHARRLVLPRGREEMYNKCTDIKKNVSRSPEC